MKEQIQIDRKELYAKVWEIPMWRLASDYGLSDVGLKKICKKLNVPTPPRGYWARLQNGYKVSCLPLPKKKPGVPDTYTVYRDLTTHGKPEEDEKQNYIPEGIDLSKPITVSQKLNTPHRVVKEVAALLKKVKPDEYGLLQPAGKSYWGIRTSPANCSRALRIFDYILKWFEGNGFQFKIQTDKNSYHPPYFLIHDEKVRILIHESAKRSDHIPTKKELEEQARFPALMTPRKWDYTPSGKLSLIIDNWGADGVRKKWTDTDSRKIEEVINSFIINMFKIAYLEKRKTQAREDEHKKWLLNQERLAEEKRRREIEEQRLAELENQAAQWEKSKQLRNYIKEVESRALKMDLPSELFEEVKKWISWANKHADDIDPFDGNGLPPLAFYCSDPL